MTEPERHWERRLLALGLGVVAALGVLITASFGVGLFMEVWEFDSPDRGLYVAGAILTVPTLLVGGWAAVSAFLYVAGEKVSGRRVAWLLVAAWVLWFAWGIPTTGGLFAAALVVFTAVALPFVLIPLLISWLVRRRSDPAAPAIVRGEAPVLRRPGLLAGLLACAIAALVCGLLAARPARVLGVDAHALSYSVSRELGGDVGFDTCRRSARGWSCEVTESHSSSSVVYRVHADSRGCWRAYLRERGRRRLDGSACIGIRDYLRIWDRLTGVATPMAS